MQKPHGKSTSSFLCKSALSGTHVPEKRTETLLTKEGRVRALKITLECFESY